MNNMHKRLAILALQMSMSASAQQAVTPVQIAAAGDGGEHCSPVILSCHIGGASSHAAAEAGAEQQERARLRQSLQERDLALAQEIALAQAHPDVVVIHSQKEPRDQPAASPAISKVFEDALGDHGPQGLTRSYYDRYGNRHEIVNKCWGLFC